MNTPLPITDERQGKASASRMARIVACPAALQLEALFPAQEGNEYSLAGTKIHKAIETRNFDELSSAEVETATAIAAQVREVMYSTFLANTDEVQIERETRLWDEEQTFSGQPDLIAMDGNTALICDYKTGRGEYPIAANNWQLKTLAVLVMLNKPTCQFYHAALIQPNIGAPSKAVWSLGEVQSFSLDIQWALLNAEHADAVEKPNAGQHCKYCRALGHCPATRNELATIAALPALEALDAADLAKLLDAADRAETVIENIKKEARTRLEAKQDVPGWTLGKGKSRKVIMDNAACAEALAHIIPTPDFLQCCTVKIGELEDAVQKAEGYTDAETKAVMETTLKGIVMTTQDRASLRRTKLAIAG